MTVSNLYVLKFGGATLATPEKIRTAAEKIKARVHTGQKLIVVTSAMGKTTDQLTELAYQVSSKPNRRELDMLLTTGERVSMALMSMALHDLECPSISFTGSQAGIFTDGNFSNAQIKELKPIRVEEALHQNKVVVLAGFQGVDPLTKEVTTLGRGGSDTTAVAMAAHFGARHCEILKDVDGVYSSDPQVVPGARLFRRIPIDVLYDFCFWGAKVLNYRSVALARDRRVPLFIGRADTFKIGTEVTFDDAELKEGEFLGAQSHREVLEISVQCGESVEGIGLLQSLLQDHGFPPVQMLSSEYDGGILKALITADADILKHLRGLLGQTSRIQLLKDKICTVTASFARQPCRIQVLPGVEREEAIRKYY